MLQFKDLTRDQAKELLFQETPSEILDRYNEPYPLEQEKIDYYLENGFIILKNVLDGETLRHARQVIQAAVLLRKEHDERKLKEKSAYEQSFLQCGYLCWDYPALKNFVFGKRFAGIARDLMNVDHARLWHDQALFKEPGGRSTDVHQDSSYWPVDKPELTTTMWLALNSVPVHKGSLYFYPQTHKPEMREYVDIFKNPHLPKHLKNKKPVESSLEPGDATFHTGLTFHGAGANQSQEYREGMTVIYIADGVKFDATDDRNATHTSCNGLEDGQIIDTQYTPRLT
ncbi:MAG: phytanoyl-CoA dioxygenase family protein [Caldithrix sp.]|nr:phytanoyl-CoA dioxygenase family protein [Caldithrix sp.]